jgi:hypothetical protein
VLTVVAEVPDVEEAVVLEDTVVVEVADDVLAVLVEV